jgi:transmembrane sensor
MAGIGFDREKITRFFRGEYSEADASYVDEVFCDNNCDKELKGLLSRQFAELLPNDDTSSKNLDHILYRINYDINTKYSSEKPWSFGNIIKMSFRIAGVIMLPLVIFIAINTHNHIYLKKESWVEIKSPAWTRVKFSLPDGTTGWLNSSSSVKYNGNFTNDRRITLEGEAFFDVMKDEKKPFVVSTNEIVVKALGTRFNIASYSNEKSVEVVLEEGKLLFNDKEMDKSILMKPNDLVTFDKTLKDISTSVVQPHKYMCWTEGKLVFRNDPLDVIARRLERWYNIDVDVNVNSDEDLRWRATFIDEGLEEVLVLLKRSLQIDYRIENRDINPDGTFPKKKVVITFKTK